MVARVGLGDFGILAACLPVEVAAVDDHAAKRGAVAADELGRGMHHDVRTVLKRAEEVRRAEGVVDYDGQAVPLGDFGNGVDVGNVGVRVAERFQINDGGVVFDGAFDLGEVVRVDEGSFDAELRKRVLEQVVRAAVDGFLRNHVVTGLREGLQRVGNGGGARSHGQASHAAFKCGDAVLEHALGGVRQAAVDVAGIGQAEAVGGVLGIAEHVARGLVDGHRAGVAGGIGAFLADVQLQGVEAEGVLGVIDELAHWKVSLDNSMGWFPSRMEMRWSVELPAGVKANLPGVRHSFRVSHSGLLSKFPFPYSFGLLNRIGA